ncbi:MAG: hypothetical protein E7319_09890 [Clostridiales bacterium]|nr:hypothetical protein [Clostridiales bacterium]
MLQDITLAMVAAALMELRSPIAMYETDLHACVRQRLEAAAFPCQHEARLAKGCRIDFLVGAIGVEIKKGKPSAATLTAQLQRYAACEAVDGLIVVTERSVRIPKSVCGKPVQLITLSQLWGVALP